MRIFLLLFLLLLSSNADEKAIREMFDMAYDSEIIEAFNKEANLLEDEKQLSRYLRDAFSSGRTELAKFFASKTKTVDYYTLSAASKDPEYLKILLPKASKEDIQKSLENFLTMANKDSSIQVLKLLIENGAEVKKKTSNGMYPIHRAALIGTSFIKVIVDAGADVNSVDKYGNTALHNAGGRGMFHNFLYLMERGADPALKNQREKTAESSFTGYEINLMKHYFKTKELPSDEWMLKIAIDEGDGFVVGKVLKKNKNLANYIFQYPMIQDRSAKVSALAHAVKMRTYDCQKLLIENGASDKEAMVKGLHDMVIARRKDILVDLLKIIPKDTMDKNGAPLWFSANRIGMFKFLFDESQGFDFRDKNGQTILNRYRFNNSMTRYLLENMKDVTSVDYTGRSLLHYAVSKRNMKFLDIVLAKKPDIHWADMNGYTPLAIAIEDRWQEGCEKLLEIGSYVPRAIGRLTVSEFMKEKLNDEKTKPIADLLKKYAKVKVVYRGVIAHAAKNKNIDHKLINGGRKIVAPSRDGLEIYDPFSQKGRMYPIKKLSPRFKVHPTADIGILNYSSENPEIWNFKTGRKAGSLKCPKDFYYDNGGFTKDGYLAYTNKKFYIHRLPGGSLNKEFQIMNGAYPYYGEGFTTNHKNSIIVLWSGKTIKIYDYQKKKFIYDDAYPENVRFAKLSDTGDKLYLLFYNDYECHVFNTRTKKEIYKTEGLSSKIIFNPNGRYMTYKAGTKVIVRDLKSWKVILEFPLKGKLLDVAADNTIMLIKDRSPAIFKVPKSWFKLK